MKNAKSFHDYESTTKSNDANFMQIHADIWIVDIPKRVRIRHRRGKAGGARGGTAG